MSHGCKQEVIAVLEKRPDTAKSIAQEIGHPQRRVSNTLCYLKLCGVVRSTGRHPYVWSLR